MVAVLIQRRNFITALYNQLHKSPLCTLTSPPPPLTQPPLANTSRHMLNLSNKLIETTVTNQASQVENWLTQLTSLHQTPPLIVGIDCEWKPQWTKGAKINKVALLQLCVDDKCLLFQLLHMDYIPLMLKEFLNDANVTVVGVGLKYDLGRLKTCYDIDCGCGIEEINALVAKSRGCSYNLRGLKDLALDVLGVDVVKKKSITMSNWAARVLKPGQIEYASLDAVLSYQMGYKLLKNRCNSIRFHMLCNSIRFHQLIRSKIKARRSYQKEGEDEEDEIVIAYQKEGEDEIAISIPSQLLSFLFVAERRLFRSEAGLYKMMLLKLLETIVITRRF